MYQQVKIMNKFRWSNIPVPEGHLITLIAGVALNIWKPFEFWQAAWRLGARRVGGGDLR